MSPPRMPDEGGAIADRMEGPSGLDLHPAPPNPTRLSKRAGYLFFMIAFLSTAFVLFGIWERGQRRFGTEGYRQDPRGMTAASDAARAVLALVPERVIGPQPEQELRLPQEPTNPPSRVEMGGAGYRPSPPQQMNVATETHELTPAERRTMQLYERQMAALDAPTRAGSGAISSEATFASGLPSRSGDIAEMSALLQALQPPSSGGGNPALVPAATAAAMPRSLLRGTGLGAANSAAEEYQLQNMQDEKNAFLERVRKKGMEDYLEATRVAPLTRYVIRAGWDIPAVLEQGINSDLPGEIRALVRQNVYDTATGRHLLIPQGARLVGRYNSQVGYGQSGLQVVWERVIYPDASTIDLSGMAGQDTGGRTGLRQNVDNHYKRIFGFGLLTSAFTAAFQLSQTHRGGVFAFPSAGEVAAAGVGREMATIGAETTRRNLNIQPTIKIPVGYRFNVRVNRDLAFEGAYPQR